MRAASDQRVGKVTDLTTLISVSPFRKSYSPETKNGNLAVQSEEE